MPYSTVVAGTTITASWGNANVRDQVVTPFASASARTSAITTPVDGMVSYQSDTKAFYGYYATFWGPLPGTFVADHTKSTATTGVGATETFHQTITFTATGQKHLLRWDGAFAGTTAGDNATLRLRYKAGATVDNTGTQIRVKTPLVDVANRPNAVSLVGTFTPAAGQTTVGVSIALQSGAGTLSIDGSAVSDAYLLLTAL